MWFFPLPVKTFGFWVSEAKRCHPIFYRGFSLTVLEVLIEEPTIDRGMVMEIPQTSELEDTVCVANEIVFGYDASKLLFKKVDFNLTMQSRIAGKVF